MARVALMRVSAIDPVRRFLRRNGVPVDRLLERLHLPVALFADPEALIPAYLGSRFMGEAARGEGAETLGAVIGQTTRLEDLGRFGRLLLQSVTLHDLILTLRRIGQSHHAGESFWLGGPSSAQRLWHRFTIQLDDWHHQSLQYSLLIVVALFRAVAGPAWRPIVYVKKGLPRTIRDVSLLRDAELIFDQPTCGVSAPPALLHLPFPVLEGAPAAGDDAVTSWNDSRPGADLTTSIRQWMTRIIRTDAVGIGALSETIGTTPRTLQRRLAEAGTSYARLLAQARFDVAARLLARDDIPIGDVAHEVGYHDPAHLTRAFLRWSGTTPSHFRRVQRAVKVEAIPAQKFRLRSGVA